AARSLLRSARRCGAARLSPEAHLPGLVGLVAAAANALRTRLRLVRLRTAARHGALRRLRLGDLRPLLVLLFLRDGSPVLVGARPAVRSELIAVAAALLRRCAVALRLLWLLVFHRSLHTGDARQVTRELLPLSGELFGPGAVLLHHFLRSALDEPRIVESLAQSLQLRLGACDLLLDTRPLRREVDQPREGA